MKKFLYIFVIFLLIIGFSFFLLNEYIIKSAVCKSHISLLHFMIFVKAESKAIEYIEKKATKDYVIITNYFGTNVYFYSMPKSLHEIFDDEYDNSTMSVCLCPYSRRTNGELANIDAWSDYIYLPWTNLTHIPDDYPLLYDKWINTHPQRGVYIATFSYKIFWDKNAEWLQKFAQEHPEYNIPMPMELKSE